MKKTIIFFMILFFVVLKNYSQDKLIFKDGTKRNCKIVAINKSTITFKDSESATVLTTKSKSEIVLAEYANGAVYIFGNEKVEEQKPITKKPETKSHDGRPKKEKSDEKNNMIGTQLFGSFLGRTGLVYERFINNHQMGISIPVMVSYNPYSSGTNNTNNPQQYSSGNNINFITGADLNYYFDTKSKYSQFFVGPRLRYGTDVMLDNTTGLSLQAQNGFLIRSMHNPKIAHTIAFGFGFVRVVSSFNSNYYAKQSFPWMSVTYRFNIIW